MGKVPLRAECASEDRRRMSHAGAGRRVVGTAALQRGGRAAVIVALFALAAWFVPAASAASFTAHGSAEQVYATGLPANAEASLVKKSGSNVATKNADPQ